VVFISPNLRVLPAFFKFLLTFQTASKKQRNVIQIKARFFARNDCSATYRIVRAKDFSPLRQKHAFIDFAFLIDPNRRNIAPKQQKTKTRRNYF
jgi:predicted oxidoreductase